MNGVTIIETKEIDRITRQLSDLEFLFKETVKKIGDGGKTWMDIKETADYMRKSTSWLYQHKTKVGFSKLGGDIVFNRKKVDAYLESLHFQSSIK